MEREGRRKRDKRRQEEGYATENKNPTLALKSGPCSHSRCRSSHSHYPSLVNDSSTASESSAPLEAVVLTTFEIALTV